MRITDAFAKHGWTAAIRGVEGGGKVEGLPAHTFLTDEGDIALKCPTEIAITDRREKELNDLGFIALVHCKGTDYAAFFGGQTTNKPKVYNLATANANANLSARLPYMLTASRFAHYIKVIMRDKIGSLHDQGERADLSQHLDHRLRPGQGRCRPGSEGEISRCARPGSTSSTCRASRAPIAPRSSSGRISSSRNSPRRSAWWPSCRRRRRRKPGAMRG